MFKKKQKKAQKPARQELDLYRFDTESDPLPQKESKTRADLVQRFEQNNEIVGGDRHKIKCKQLEKILTSIKNILEEQLDYLLIGEPIAVSEHYHVLLSSELFRVRQQNMEGVIDDLGKVIQALELMYSKLFNNQKVKDVLYVKDQSQLLLFFKHLFGKPYTVCNLPHFRKVLNTVWQHQIFQSFDPKKMADHLRHWCVGIEYPLNPASIPLHRFVFNNPTLIKRYSLLQCNSVSYCHIDSGDCMGLTPLLVAVHSNKSAAYEHIIKSGASLFCCPLSQIKNRKKVTKSKKSSKQTTQITWPIIQRHQYNIFETLMHHRQFQQIVNILSLNEVYKLKRLKKSNREIRNILKQIPDCCLQIEWKTYKGFLSFKQLPKDIITVYKKKGNLRIDYHIDNMQQPNTQKKHYSILLRTGPNQQKPSQKQKLEYYYIDHRLKKIYNFMKQIHSQKLKLRYEQLTSFGNVQEQYISSIKSTVKSDPNQNQNEIMDLNVQYAYENVVKAPLVEFQRVELYERMLFQSEVVQYRLLEASEDKCTVGQVIGQLPKVKAKLIKQSSNFKIQWTKQKINLRHISFILAILDKKSPFFLKIMRLFDTFLQEQAYKGKYDKKLPYKMSVDLGSDFSLQAQIKNLTYMTLDDGVFGLQYRTKTMNYQQQNIGLQSLQQTMIMSQNYSINMSRFLGRTQKLLQTQQQEANRKFEQLLSREISGNLSDDDESEKRQQFGSKVNSDRWDYQNQKYNYSQNYNGNGNYSGGNKG